MKVQFGRWGLKHDYRGAHVTWTIKGRMFLGEVVGIRRCEVRGATFFQVRHFNGEDAGEVAASFVDILEREYETVAE